MTAGVFGVLAGSWTRSVFAGALAALVLFLPPIALLPRFVFDQTLSAGFYGAVQTDRLIGAQLAAWQLVAMVGVAAVAAAAALMRHDRGRRLVLLALAGTGATAAAIALGPRAVG
ncbi:MAG: hypothetical protein LC777_11010 [Actinobacteria bacterium]|nr:hypothetical protein [Actinomycetota bacterium]